MRRGVTPIDQLINLEDEEQSREETMNKIKVRSIRNTGGRGGMTNYEKIYSPNVQEHQPTMQQQPIIQEPTIQQQPIMKQLMENYEEIHDDYKFRGNCIDVAQHTHNCPVCSKLYNTDKTIYMVIIGLLLIVTLILIKKVLEK